MGQKDVMRLPMLILVLFTASSRFEEQVQAAEYFQQTIRCPCKAFTCSLSQNCACLEDETNSTCSCSCHERMLNIPERPVPRLRCKCEGYTCSQAESCLCVKRVLWPQDEETCSCSCLRSGLAEEPRDGCSCEALDIACKSGEICTCVAREPSSPNCTLENGCCSCGCTRPSPVIPLPRTVCPCDGFSCRINEQCNCVEKHSVTVDSNLRAELTTPARGTCSCSCREFVVVDKPPLNATLPPPDAK
ncbi:hypothetical protein Mapa_012982 [Marchantia paleacea]|nr:hypothetical protein Mapa_012982 [Marchantia paleacea]